MCLACVWCSTNRHGRSFWGCCSRGDDVYECRCIKSNYRSLLQNTVRFGKALVQKRPIIWRSLLIDTYLPRTLCTVVLSCRMYTSTLIYITFIYMTVSITSHTRKTHSHKMITYTQWYNGTHVRHSCNRHGRSFWGWCHSRGDDVYKYRCIYSNMCNCMSPNDLTAWN